MKYIEYAIVTNIKIFEPTILLVDCSEISLFEQTNNPNICKLITKNNDNYLIYGTYKTITNRFFYTLSKKHNIYDDEIIRPSVRVIHRPSSLEPDVAFLDLEQMKAFIYAIDSEFDISKLSEYSQELLKK